jgi:hypothetical protein
MLLYLMQVLFENASPGPLAVFAESKRQDGIGGQIFNRL